MAIQISINQAGKPAGTSGLAREDLDLGLDVLLACEGGVLVTEYQWTLLNAPPDETVTAPSLSSLLTPDAISTTINPDNGGTYLIRLWVDQGFGLGFRVEDRAEITFYAGPTLATDADGWPRRAPAYDEVRHHNAPDAVEPGGNTHGWRRELERWHRSLGRAWRLASSTGDGRVNAFPGSPRVLYSDGITEGGVWSRVTSALAEAVIDNLAIPWTKLRGVGTEVLEPSGWPTPGSDSTTTVAWVEGTRTLTITPLVNTPYYVAGARSLLTVALSVVWPDAAGEHFFYINALGALVTTQNIDTWISVLAGAGCPVAALYWHDVQNTVIVSSDERHGLMEGVTHRWAHRGIGALWVGGGGLSGFTFGDGSLAAHSQFNAENATYQDEDIFYGLTSGSPQTQQMSPLISRVFALVGTLWVTKTTPDVYAFMQSGANYTGGTYTGAAGGRVAYNQIVAGVGSLLEAAEGDFVLCHHGLTTEISGSTTGTNWKVVSFVGQNAYANLTAARAGALTELNQMYLSGLPVQEIVWLGTSIIQTNSTYASPTKSRARQATDAAGNLVDYIDWRTNRFGTGGIGAGGVADHGLLTGLSDDDHSIYVLADGTRAVDHLSVTNYAAFGATPSTTGTIRLERVSTINFRNQLNTLDLTALSFTSVNAVQIGGAAGIAGASIYAAGTPLLTLGSTGVSATVTISPATTAFNHGAGGDVIIGDGYVSVGPNPATAGAVRLPNLGSVSTRNGTNAADLAIAYADVNNNIYLSAPQANNTYLYSGASYSIELRCGIVGAGQFIVNATTATFNFGANDVVVGDAYLSVGANASTSGYIRLPVNAYVAGRNAANGADINIAGINGSNVIVIGGANGAGVTLMEGANARVSVVAATTTFDHGAGNNVLIGDGFIAIGGALANGAIRLANNLGIWSETTGASDTPLISLDASNNLQLGYYTGNVGALVVATTSIILQIGVNQRFVVNDTTATFNFGTNDVIVGDDYIQIGATPATAGSLRLPNNKFIEAMNQAGTQNIVLLYASTADAVNIGGTYATSVNLNVGGNFRLQVGSTVTTFDYGSADVVIGDGYVQVGANPATAGALRLANNTAIYERNAANGQDISLLSADGADGVHVGDTSYSAILWLGAVTSMNRRLGIVNVSVLTAASEVFTFTAGDSAYPAAGVFNLFQQLTGLSVASQNVKSSISPRWIA